MNTTKQAVIISAESLKNRWESNRALTLNLESSLIDCQFTFNRLSYFENGELSKEGFIVIPKNEIEIDILKNFAFDNFNQNDIIHQDSNGMSYLIDKNGMSKKIGKLIKVNKSETIKNYYILNDEVYTCV